MQVETRDPKTGELIRYNADDDTTTLGDMLRQERFGGGSSDQNHLDAEFARQIMTDGGFKVCGFVFGRICRTCVNAILRTISITWMTMLRSLGGRRCGRTR